MTTPTELRARAQRAEQQRTRDADSVQTLTTVTTPAGRACWYPSEAVLTDEEVAEVLNVSLKTVRKWPIKKVYPSPTMPRTLFRDIIAFLESLAA